MNYNKFFVFNTTFQQDRDVNTFDTILLCLAIIIIGASLFLLALAFKHKFVDDEDLSDLDNGIIFLWLIFLIAIIATSSYVTNCLITKSELITRLTRIMAIISTIIGLVTGCAGALALIVILINNCQNWIDDTIKVKWKLIKTQTFIEQNKTKIEQIINQLWPATNYQIFISDYRNLDKDDCHYSISQIYCQIRIIKRQDPFNTIVINWNNKDYQDIMKPQYYQKVFQINQSLATRYYLLNKNYQKFVYHLEQSWQRVVINQTTRLNLSNIF